MTIDAAHARQERRGGLGRGLGALIPTGGLRVDRTPSDSSTRASTAIFGPGAHPPGEVPGATLQNLPVGAVVPNPKQPRQHFDDDAMAELRTSIAAFGLLQPIVVRPAADGRYELVMGERRWRAATELALTEIPAIIRSTDDDAMLRDALLENLHRQQLNPLEEAAAYQQLLTEFGTTHEELATRIGRSRSQVSNTIRLLTLPVGVQRRVAAGVLSAGHARALVSLRDAEAQDELAGRIVAEGLSVRATEELVLTGAGTRPRRPPREPPAPDPSLEALADRLADRLDTRVHIDAGRRKGRLVIEYGSREDLDRILTIVDTGGLLHPPR